MAQIALKNLTKKFGNTTAIKNLTLEIRDQEFFVLLGPTGAGKTTTLRCIAGLEKPENGDVLIDNQNVVSWSPAERDVALVFQYYSLYPHYTVKQNLEFPLKSKIRNTAPEEMKRRVAQVAETLRIGDLLERETGTLSGGEMQRVAIGRAIVRDPRIFLMDEPLSNVDAKLREILRAELKSLQMNLGATFLYVTHDQVEAMTMGERVGVLNKGEIVQIGTPYEVYNNPRNTFVATFVGTPAMNLFDAVIQRGRVIIVRDVFEFDLEPSALDRIKGISGEVKIGIRSEGIPIHVEKGIEGQIYSVENMGMEKIVTLKIGDCLFRATADAKLEVEIDSKVQFYFDQGNLHFFQKESGENLLYNDS
ncbi:MAG: ATP-binding cassette domain-containing protein [candidate division Zixibacteria bacterium]|nr:ATP-binding cassette domain-containing protein [candidate division Zixibacteria bacterium]